MVSLQSAREAPAWKSVEDVSSLSTVREATASTNEAVSKPTLLALRPSLMYSWTNTDDSSAHIPSWSFKFGSAPRSRRWYIISSSAPIITAICNGVLPRISGAFIHAPALVIKFTAAKELLYTAAWSICQPDLDTSMCTRAPRCSKNSMCWSLPEIAAQYSGVHPFQSWASIPAPASSRSCAMVISPFTAQIWNGVLPSEALSSTFILRAFSKVRTTS